jgi:hypothetical protein
MHFAARRAGKSTITAWQIDHQKYGKSTTYG